MVHTNVNSGPELIYPFYLTVRTFDDPNRPGGRIGIRTLSRLRNVDQAWMAADLPGTKCALNEEAVDGAATLFTNETRYRGPVIETTFVTCNRMVEEAADGTENVDVANGEVANEDEELAEETQKTTNGNEDGAFIDEDGDGTTGNELVDNENENFTNEDENLTNGNEEVSYKKGVMNDNNKLAG